MTEPKIRSATRRDARFISDLSRAVFSEYNLRAAAHALEMTVGAGVTALVAEIGERPVGFAVVCERRDGAYLDAIAVTESARGRGVGRRLLAASEAVARRAGARKLVLVTADSNLAALDLFLRSSYRVTERHARFYPRGQSALRMEKKL